MLIPVFINEFIVSSIIWRININTFHFTVDYDAEKIQGLIVFAVNKQAVGCLIKIVK